MPAVRVECGELHLDGRHAPVRLALEIAKVPPGSDKVGAHALDGVDDHTDAVHRSRMTLVDDMSAGEGVRPEPMNDVSLWFVLVWTIVGEPAFRAVANFETGYGGGAENVEGDLEVIREIGTDDVLFWVRGVCGRFVRDRELIGLARALIKTRRRGDEIGDINGTPDSIPVVGVVYLARELYGWVPQTG